MLRESISIGGTLHKQRAIAMDIPELQRKITELRKNNSAADQFFKILTKMKRRRDGFEPLRPKQVLEKKGVKVSDERWHRLFQEMDGMGLGTLTVGRNGALKYWTWRIIGNYILSNTELAKVASGKPYKGELFVKRTFEAGPDSALGPRSPQGAFLAWAGTGPSQRIEPQIQSASTVPLISETALPNFITALTCTGQPVVLTANRGLTPKEQHELALRLVRPL